MIVILFYALKIWTVLKKSENFLFDAKCNIKLVILKLKSFLKTKFQILLSFSCNL